MIDRRIITVMITDETSNETSTVSADRYEITGPLREALYALFPENLNTLVDDDDSVGIVIDRLVYNLTQGNNYDGESYTLALSVSHNLSEVPA